MRYAFQRSIDQVELSTRVALTIFQITTLCETNASLISVEAVLAQKLKINLIQYTSRTLKASEQQYYALTGRRLCNICFERIS